jgi:glycosyltransferase involved in cell wall biosynthesis
MTALGKTVLLIAPSAYTLGGVASWIDYLLPGLEKYGWNATLGLVSGPRYHMPVRYLEAHPYHRAVSVHSNSGTRYGRVKAIRALLRKLKPDVVLTANVPDAVVATAAERSQGNLLTRLVMSCHGIQRDLFEDMYRLRNELDLVVCTNKLARRLSESVGDVASGRVHHARCGTTVPDKLPPHPQTRQFTIAFVGRLEQDQKRVLDLVEIGLSLRSKGINFSMIVAGSGPDESLLKERLRSEGLDERFRFLGFVNPTVLNNDIYQHADALLLTSRWETGPIVLWEAMAAGLPIVTSRYLGLASESILFHRKNCLIFDVGDCDGAAIQLESLSVDRILGESLRSRAFSDVSSMLTTEISIAQWECALRKAMGLDPVSTSTLNYSEFAQQAGRLDRWLGPSLAESIRNLRASALDTGPAGEWPHTLGSQVTSDDEFWRKVERMDRIDDIHGRSPGAEVAFR